MLVSEEITTNLDQRLWRVEQNYVRIIKGVVVDASPLSVLAAGDEEPLVDVYSFGGWTPTPGQNVFLLSYGPSIICLPGVVVTEPGDTDNLPSNLVLLSSLLASAGTPVAFGVDLLTMANAAAVRSALGLGTAALADSGDFDAAGDAAAALSAALAAIAALTPQDLQAAPYARVSNSGTITVENNTNSMMEYDTLDESNAVTVALTTNLTGTVSKTNGTNTLTGVGTLFTTELAVGDRIQVGAEKRWVSAITNNTSLTVSVNWGTTLAGTAYTLRNIKMTVTVAGLYDLGGYTAWAANATGKRRMQALVNGAAVTGWTHDVPTITSTGNYQIAYRWPRIRLAVNDIVTMRALQDSGGQLNMATGHWFRLGWAGA